MKPTSDNRRLGTAWVHRGIAWCRRYTAAGTQLNHMLLYWKELQCELAKLWLAEAGVVKPRAAPLSEANADNFEGTVSSADCFNVFII